MAGIVVVNLTYTRARVVLNGFLMAGVGAGSALYTQLFNILLPELGWRGTLLITAGLTLNTAVAGMCMSPYLCVYKPGTRDRERKEKGAAVNTTISQTLKTPMFLP